MFKIAAQASPKEENELFGKVDVSHVEFYIDYKDFGGALILAHFYLDEQDWDMRDFEDGYWELESEDDLEKSLRPFYREAKEFGYCIVYHVEEGN